jgi:tetratricopeptide (TPR) repeat protein
MSDFHSPVLRPNCEANDPLSQSPASGESGAATAAGSQNDSPPEQPARTPGHTAPPLSEAERPESAPDPPERRSSTTTRSGLKTVLGELRAEFRKKLTGAIVAGAIGLAWVAVGTPSPAQLWRSILARAVPAAAGTHFTILVADLIGDDATDTQTRLLAEALESNAGLEVVRIGRALVEGSVGSVRERREQAEGAGRRWLKEKNADVLLWGYVVGKELQIRFLSVDGGPSTAQALPSLGAQLTMPADFGSELGAQLETVTLSLVAHASQAQGMYLVDLLRPAAQKLERLLADGVAIPEASRAGLSHSYGVALATIGAQSGDRERIETAMEAYRHALEVFSREDTPIAWAMVQHDMGRALTYLSQGQTGTVHLVEAVSAFQAALQERTRERAPLDWAETQHYMGYALSDLGDRETGTGRLEEALVAYRAALTERTREQVPLAWAATQINIGTALHGIAERNGKAELLEQAVTAYRSALLEVTRQRQPLWWAQTQSNLGNSLQRLGEREGGTARLAEAVEAYQAALQELSRDQVPLLWAEAQNSLGAALQTMGERERGTARLEEAVAAFEAALQERTRERVPLEWAKTQNNLGTTLETLAEREGGTRRLQEAISAYRAALYVFRFSDDQYAASQVEDNLNGAEALLAKRRRATSEWEPH